MIMIHYDIHAPLLLFNLMNLYTLWAIVSHYLKYYNLNSSIYLNGSFGLIDSVIRVEESIKFLLK